MDLNMIKQIQRINSGNAKLLTKIRAIKDIVDINILSGEYNSPDIKSLIDNSKVYNKKAQDSMVSLNKIYRFLRYDNFDLSMKHFFKNSEYVSDTIPSIIFPNSHVAFNAQFKNTGVFYNWTEAKGIKLKLDIVREDGSVYDSEYALLDTDIAQNVPGDELSNGDYGKVKIFNLAFDVDFPAGVYTFSISVTDVVSEDFNSIFSKHIVVRSE